MPSPHPRDLALRELVQMNELEHQNRVLVLFRECLLDCFAQKIQERFLARDFFRLWPAIEKIFRGIRRGRNVNAKALATLEVHEAVCGYGQ